MNYISELELMNKKSFDYKQYADQLASVKKSWLTKKPIAHRGLFDEKKGIPENSLKAFEEAIKKGYAIELDVHQLADGNLAVFHDNGLRRMCGKGGKISSLKTEELKDCKLSGTDESIPTLDEVLKLVDGRVPVLVELKSYSLTGKFESALYEKLKEYKGKIAIESFNPYVLNWFKTNAPEIIRGQLVSGKSYIPGNTTINNIIANNKYSMPHFVASQFSIADKVKTGDKPLIAWTVRTQEQYDKAKQYCDNIIFDGFTPA